MGWILGQLIEAGDAGERRSEPRMRLGLELDMPSGSRGLVRVLDLSPSGMMIHCEHPFEPGDRMLVELPEAGTIEARVIWRRMTLLGCEFGEPLSRAALAAMQLRAPPAAAITG